MAEATRIDILEVVRGYGHQPTEAGLEWRLLCPFHTDTDPSLYINPEKNMWTCFGCQRGGTAIQWVAYEENISFAEAAKRLGVEMNPLHELKGRLRKLDEEPEEDEQTKELYILTRVAGFARQVRAEFDFDSVEAMLATFDALETVERKSRFLQIWEEAYERGIIKPPGENYEKVGRQGFLMLDNDPIPGGSI